MISHQKIYIIIGLVFVIKPSFSGELCITSMPENIAFEKQDGILKNNDIHNLIQFTLGLHAEKTTSWQGLRKMDIFNPPKANLFIEIIAPESLSFKLSECGMTYHTEDQQMATSPAAYLNEEYLNTRKNGMFSTFYMDGEHFNFATKDSSKLPQSASDVAQMKVKLQNSDSIYFTLMSLMKYLNISNDRDVMFLGQLQSMHDVLLALHDEVTTNKDASFTFEISGLVLLASEYGVDSNQVKEAAAILDYYITTYVRSMNQRFNGNLLSEVLVTRSQKLDAKHIRRSRSILQTNTAAESSFTFATPNSSDYAVIFNITLWFMIAFALSVLAASYMLWFMDPGQDSIIYRMTSSRIKMD